MGADGVGTKLQIAQSLNSHHCIGVDVVAMCVNDILCVGAEPLAFLDYFACGELNVPVAAEVIEGVANGCRQSDCVLAGGETAEMPGMYNEGKYDIAGFACGVAEYDELLPRLDAICDGDALIGLPSGGVHSNGFSLINKLMMLTNFTVNDRAPFSLCQKTFGKFLI